MTGVRSGGKKRNSDHNIPTVSYCTKEEKDIGSESDNVPSSQGSHLLETA